MSALRPAGTVLRRRRWVVLAVIVAVGAALFAVLGHDALDASLNLLVPGAGLYGEHRGIGLALTALSIVATVAWLRWGVDWALAATVLLAVVVSVALAEAHVTATNAPPVARLSHEFPLVVLVIAVLGWLRVVAGHIPFARRLSARRRRTSVDLRTLPPVSRSRAAALLALAGVKDPAVGEAVDADDVRRRARRIGLVARGRLGGDPLRVDHAHARAALALTGRLDDDQQDRLRHDARKRWAGVPCSEPGWIRPLDATLAAFALRDDAEVGRRWAATLTSSMALRRGHRPAWVWAPLGIAAGAAPAWEHAASTALARAAGWIDDDRDWLALRRRAFGAAARGVDVRDDERLIAAARCWVALVDDPVAAEVLARPTVRHDPLARALDAVAGQLATDPAALTAA
jgi:hypothetical protein